VNWVSAEMDDRLPAWRFCIR